MIRDTAKVGSIVVISVCAQLGEIDLAFKRSLNKSSYFLMLYRQEFMKQVFGWHH